jgi:hypothetical protein
VSRSGQEHYSRLMAMMPMAMSTSKTPWLLALVVNSVLGLSTSQEARLFTSDSDSCVSRDGDQMVRHDSASVHVFCGEFSYNATSNYYGYAISM